MNLSEYIEYDAIGLAQLITSGQVSAHEVQQVARQAIESVNPELNALVGELFDEPLQLRKVTRNEPFPALDNEARAFES